MSLKLLHYFLGLQVPNVHAVVLRSRYNPLATSDRKVCKNAVLLIPVPCVRLETLSFAVVPQLECVVQSGCQDVLAIW